MATEELENSLKKIEQYLEILVRFQYLDVKKKAFESETEERAFELTGTMGRNEICKELSMSPNTLSKLWNKWFDMGLLTKQGNSYVKALE